MASKSFVFSFDTVEVREREFSLVKADQALTIEPKAFRVLLFLLRNPQRLVSKEEISEDVPGEPEAAGNPNGVSGVETNVGSRKAVLVWVLTGCVVLALSGTGAIWYLRPPLPPPQITKYTKITHDGLQKHLVGT